jgi:3-oxoacyl-[acyl-carrier-protein] synthase II
LADSKFDARKSEVLSDTTAVFGGNCVINLVHQHMDISAYLGKANLEISDLEGFFLNISYNEIAHELGIEGPVFSLDSACASGVSNVIQAYHFVKHGFDGIKAAIVMCQEHTVDPMMASIFNKISALNKEFNDNPEDSPAPFSTNRCGFTFGEGAAVAVIEEFEQARARGAPIYCELVGSGHTSDAFHLTRALENGEGLQQAMRNALDEAGLEPADIDHI